VVKKAGGADPLTDAAIKTHLKVFSDKGVISRYGIPERILFIDQIPKTSVGKFDKKTLRDRYGDM
jgi:fatty-acyl-CoA synthase